MSEGAEVYARVQRNLELAEPMVGSLDGLDREAAWRLFSVLAALEEVAVIAAERGDGVPGQLADELVHRETFAGIAARLHPDLAMTPSQAPDSVRALVNYLRGLEGPASLAALNLIGEAWLGGVFSAVARWGLADELFAGIAAEEARHSALAHSHVAAHGLDGDPGFGPVVTRLEELIYAVSVDPEFVLPLVHFGGERAVGELAETNAATHRKQCEALGVKPGILVRAVGTCGLDSRSDVDVFPVIPDAWEESARNLGLGPISNVTEVRYPWPAPELEARVVAAVGAVLARYPNLNRTVSNFRNTTYHPALPVVGVRRLWDQRRLVMTVYVKQPHRRSPDTLRRHLSVQAGRLRDLPYQRVAAMDPSLHRMLPPPRCAATVTNVSGDGVERGLPTLSALEGATWAVAIGWLGDRPRRGRWSKVKWVPHATIGVVADHRIHNGRELGLFSAEVARLVEEGL